jgi:hypothetical protein
MGDWSRFIVAHFWPEQKPSKDTAPGLFPDAD